MLAKLIIWFKGYLIVELTGFSPERFLNLCHTNHIILWGITPFENGYKFYISKRAFFLVRTYVKKTNVQLEIKGKKGFPFLVKRYKNRKWFFIGFLLSMLFVAYSSLFIWDIDVTGNDIYTTEELTSYLTQNGFHLGIKKKQIDCNALEMELREHFDEISWISCCINGTQLSISLKEAEETQAKSSADTQAPPCDIVATSDATIQSIVVQNGTPLVKEGDMVKKGDVLISGAVNLYDDANEVLQTNFITAKGKILGQIAEPYNDELKLQFYEKQFTGNTTSCYQLQFFGYQIPLVSRRTSFSTYDTIKSHHTVKLGKTFYLPVTFTTIERKEYILSKASITPETGKARAQKRLADYTKKLSEKGVEIIENHVTIEQAGTSICASGYLIVSRSIGTANQISIQNTTQKENTVNESN